jgi:hypothetical protein
MELVPSKFRLVTGTQLTFSTTTKKRATKNHHQKPLPKKSPPTKPSRKSTEQTYEDRRENGDHIALSTTCSPFEIITHPDQTSNNKSHDRHDFITHADSNNNTTMLRHNTFHELTEDMAVGGMEEFRL